MSNQVTAWAAVLAAVTSIATLLVTTIISGRREQRRWVREALTDAFVAYLDASWRGSDVLRRGGVLETADPEGEARLQAAQEAYEEMRTQLTRLRLLASPPVVEAGQRLLRSQRRAIDEAALPDGTALQDVSAERRRLVLAAKAEMGLRRA